MVRQVCNVLFLSKDVFSEAELVSLQNQNRILQCPELSNFSFPYLTISLTEAVCFSILSHCPKSLHQLLVGRAGASPEPCAEHLPCAGLRVSGIVVLDQFQLCIFHPQLEA